MLILEGGMWHTPHKKVWKQVRSMAWNLKEMNVELKQMWFKSSNVTKNLKALTSQKQIFIIHAEFKTTTIIKKFTRTNDVLTKGGIDSNFL